MSSSILDLLERSSTLALSSVEASSPQGEGLRAIVDFAQSVAAQNSGKLNSFSSSYLFS